MREAAAHLPLWKDYLQTVLDPAHIGSEITWTILFDLAIYPLVKRWVRRHDRAVHGGGDGDG